MPQLVLPRTNEDLIRFFETALRIVAEERANGLHYVEADWVTQANAFLVTFKTKVRGLTALQYRRAKEIEDRRGEITRLEVYVRDYLNGLKRMIFRERLSTSLFSLYSLPETGKLPNPTGIDDVISWAEKIVTADANATEAGYPAMCNPTAAQVSVLLIQAKTEHAQISAADRALDVAQDEIEALRVQGYALARDAAQQLNFHLRNLSAPDRRRIMSRYGFRYQHDTHEASPTETPR